MKKHEAVSVVILAAGNSSRMSSPKPFLPFDAERNFMEKIIDAYIAAGINDFVVVINENMERRLRLILSMNYKPYDIELVVNRYPEKGRFYSVQLGLKMVKNGSCFIQNIDNPFTTNGLLLNMMGMVTDDNCIIPAFNNKEGHPVLLSKGILEDLVLLKGDEHNLRTELNRFPKVKMDWPFEDILANINTREDYGNYFLSFVALT